MATEKATKKTTAAKAPQAEAEIKKAATKTETKTAVKPAEKPVVKAVEKPAAKAEEKPAAKTAAKPAARKTAAKTAAPRKKETKVYIQYYGKEFDQQEILDRIIENYEKETGKKKSSIRSMEVYIKPEDNAAYYVINGQGSSISL